ncbi:MAG: hypothetical protein KAS32_10995 [Candidatus Peribacteraceae bacterium]|nr:hypothetical protein [Candidatus Peribacteraceae bacterium]
MILDIGDGELTIQVHGQHVLTVGQTSDDEVINLFLYPINGEIIVSDQHAKDQQYTHEVLIKRR